MSDTLGSVACKVGHLEPDPDVITASIVFTGGRETRAGIPLVSGGFDEAARQSLDDAMVAGGYREIGAPGWESATAASREVAGFRIVIESARIRVEHGAKLVHERVDWYLPRYRRTCSARAWSLGAQIAIERSCRTLDEGVEVLTIDAFICDSTRCR